MENGEWQDHVKTAEGLLNNIKSRKFTTLLVMVNMGYGDHNEDIKRLFKG